MIIGAGWRRGGAQGEIRAFQVASPTPTCEAANTSVASRPRVSGPQGRARLNGPQGAEPD
jgi:hypothetical protein